MSGATARGGSSTPPAEAGLLIYDGDCGFCTATARWVQRRLPDGSHVVASQEADLGVLGLTAEDVARSAWWIGIDGVPLDEHRSMAGALRAMGGLWSVLGRLLTFGPISPLAGFVYRRVAANRYRIRKPGTSPTCDRPD